MSTYSWRRPPPLGKVLEWGGPCDDCGEPDFMVYSFDEEGCTSAVDVDLGEEAGAIEFTGEHEGCTGLMCWSCAWLMCWDKETMEEYDARTAKVVPPPTNPRCPDCGHRDHHCSEARKVNVTKRCSCVSPIVKGL